ncbi:MAG: hypothetical protein PHF37_05435 [Phycisphaerae bacterium]|nr:hypothetical protein [Phycisphaerae bacterium]
MKDLFGNKAIQKPVHVNIYADEIQAKVCPNTDNEWHYIGLVIEDIDHPLLDDIKKERFCNNFDTASLYYEKNNKTVHWSEISSADQKNVCKRWLEYILDVNRSEDTFYSYILGLNNSKLKAEEFDQDDEFNSKYNRFFRSAIIYSLKTIFSGKNIIVENIFHEEGQQQNNKYFPWHCIYKMKQEDRVSFLCKDIIFLPKDHKKRQESNLIQLCDCVLGVSTSIIHGIEKSNNSQYREELAGMYLPLLKRVIKEPFKKNSSYKHYNRILMRFFPKDITKLGDDRRYVNQFYSDRIINYAEQKIGQLSWF